MEKLLFAVLISLCVERFMYIHISSVPTEVIAKLFASVLFCLYSDTVSAGLDML